jgi:hypothetical protein
MVFDIQQSSREARIRDNSHPEARNIQEAHQDIETQRHKAQTKDNNSEMSHQPREF